MKKIHILAMGLVLLLLLTACSSTVNVVGEWKVWVSELDKTTNQTEPVEQVWTFNEDGTGSKATKGLSDGKELNLTFTYTLAEGQLTLKFTDEAEPEQQFGVRGNAKKITLTGGARTITLEK
ncbi:MAG: lipocalin family protein [Clostridia bacterium]|nr:lipocalin family protein [Clostridia bacterium]